MKKVTIEAQTHYVKDDTLHVRGKNGHCISLVDLTQTLKAEVTDVTNIPYVYIYGDAVQHKQVNVKGKFIGKAIGIQGHSLIEVYTETIQGVRYKYILWKDTEFKLKEG